MVKICLTDNAHSVSQVYFYPSIHTQAAVHFQGYEAKRNNVPYLGGSKMHPKVWAVLGYAGLLLQPARPGKASPVVYMAANGGDFGTVDLGTGAFTFRGNSGQTLFGLGELGNTLYGLNSSGTLYNVNQANGSLMSVGSSSTTIDDFGSTLTGLYAIGTDANLYSINSATGGSTKIGALGVSLGGFRNLSTNSSTLYFADGMNFYTVNTATGAATLVGPTGGAQMGAVVQLGTILYGGQDSPSLAVDTINITTGAATTGPPLAGENGSFFGLAPIPASSVPEPGTWGLLSMGLAVVVLLLWGRRRRNEFPSAESAGTSRSTR